MATLIEDTGQYDGAPAALSGEDFLKTISPAVAPIVRDVAAGKIPVSPYMASRTQGQQLLSAVSQYDPTFDSTNYNARHDTATDFSTKGKSGQNILAIQTLMHHLNTISNDYSALDNGNYDWLNNITNKTMSALGNPRIQTGLKNIDIDSNAISGEMAKVFRSVGMSDADIASWQKNFGSNLSPAEQKAAVSKAVEVVAGRMEPIISGYNRVMNSNKTLSDFMTDPVAKAVYQKYYGGSTVPAAPASNGKTVVQTGTYGGKKVVKYSDGSVDYANQ